MSKAKYGLSHLEKLANEIQTIYNPANLELVDTFLTVELDTTEEPILFPAFNNLAQKHLCKITQVATNGDNVAFFIEQD